VTRPPRIAQGHCERISAVDLDHRAGKAAADVGAVEDVMHRARPGLGIGGGASEPAGRSRRVVHVESRREHIRIERLDRVGHTSVEAGESDLEPPRRED
jgi:hypothetical protein